jgi:hypothetical protein
VNAFRRLLKAGAARESSIVRGVDPIPGAGVLQIAKPWRAARISAKGGEAQEASSEGNRHAADGIGRSAWSRGTTDERARANGAMKVCTPCRQVDGIRECVVSVGDRCAPPAILEGKCSISWSLDESETEN